jgi:UDP-perosamine 4-acetyltransferase
VNRRIVVGAGAQGRVVLENWRAQHPADEFLFVDDNPKVQGRAILGAKVAGTVADLQALGGSVVLAMGNNAVRLRLGRTLKVAWGCVVHPSAVVMPSATLGPGTVVFAGCVVNTQAAIGAHSILNTATIVEHDCIFGDGSSLSPGCTMGGRVSAGEGVFLGAGVTVVPRVAIGAWTMVGAGAVVSKDLPERILAVGVPARVVRPITDADWSKVL